MSMLTYEAMRADVADMIGEVLNIAWRLEGAMDYAAEKGPLDDEKLGRLATDMRELEGAARVALERLVEAVQ